MAKHPTEPGRKPFLGDNLTAIFSTALVDRQIAHRRVVRDERRQLVAFGGRVLGVAAHVEVQPRAVAQMEARHRVERLAILLLAPQIARRLLGKLRPVLL